MTNFPETKPDNPYTYGSIILYDDGDVGIESEVLDVPPSSSDQFYLTLEGDTLSNIAYRFYSNSKYHFIIAMANEIDFTFEILSGTRLRIPDISNLPTP